MPRFRGHIILWEEGVYDVHEEERFPKEFRQQMVELVRSGRTAEELSKEFESSAQAIRNWVKQASSMPVGGPTERRARSARSSEGYVARTSVFVKSGRY